MIRSEGEADSDDSSTFSSRALVSTHLMVYRFSDCIVHEQVREHVFSALKIDNVSSAVSAVGDHISSIEITW